MWDVFADRDSAEIQIHINTFGAFDLDYTRSNDETIIRIPLRTREQAKTSKNFQDEISIKNIEDALEDFGQEIEEGGLLFLKHVRKIVIRVNHDIILLAQVLNNDLNSANMRKAIPLWRKQRSISFPVMSPKLFGHSLSNYVQPLFAFPKSCGPIISVQLLKRLGHRRKWTRIISVRFTSMTKTARHWRFSFADWSMKRTNARRWQCYSMRWYPRSMGLARLL